MKGTTKDIKKKTDGRGGPRKGAGRKSSGKKYFSYFLPEDLGDKVSKEENPSEFVEDAIKNKFAWRTVTLEGLEGEALDLITKMKKSKNGQKEKNSTEAYLYNFKFSQDV